jgi:hypothetical protein
MNATQPLRPGNRVLDYLLAHYDITDAKTKRLVECLPALGAQLCTQADDGAKSLASVQSGNLVSRFFRGVTASTNQTLLARCILDLMLSIYFEEVLEYCTDKELSSLLVDSLLYQATGSEANSPDESDILDNGTQNARGIHKFVVGRQLMPHIGDIAGWLFGKEVAAIRGNPKDIAIILSVSPFSILVRGHAKWTTRHFLYGTLPSEAEQRAFEASLTEQNQKLLDMIKKFNP